MRKYTVLTDPCQGTVIFPEDVLLRFPGMEETVKSNPVECLFPPGADIRVSTTTKVIYSFREGKADAALVPPGIGMSDEMVLIVIQEMEG